jgi:hypothetical protein
MGYIYVQVAKDRFQWMGFNGSDVEPSGTASYATTH